MTAATAPGRLERVPATQIAVRGVSKRYRTSQGAQEALASVDLEIPRGQFVSLLGPPDYISANPDKVRCFVDGVRKGLEAAKADPAAALAALYEANPETKDNEAGMEALLDGVFEYTGDSFLDQTAEKWDATQQILAEAGIIESTLEPTEFFTNDYQ